MNRIFRNAAMRSVIARSTSRGIRTDAAAAGAMPSFSSFSPATATAAMTTAITTTNITPTRLSAGTTTTARGMSTMDTMETGTKMYMSLYPEGSTDGAVRLGNIVPDFSCETTHGSWDSFLDWKKGKWAILFSHPADFTPVCTTEIGRLALKYDELEAMDCLVATLSVDPVKSHQVSALD